MNDKQSARMRVTYNANYAGVCVANIANDLDFIGDKELAAKYAAAAKLILSLSNEFNSKCNPQKDG